MPRSEVPILVVAPNYRYVTEWCRRQDPRINPRYVHTVTGSANIDRIFGVEARDIRFVFLGYPDRPIDREIIESTLIARGFLQ